MSCFIGWTDETLECRCTLNPSPYFASAKISTRITWDHPDYSCLHPDPQWKEMWPYMSLGTKPILLKLCCGNNWQCVVSFHLLLCMTKPFHIRTYPVFHIACSLMPMQTEKLWLTSFTSCFHLVWCPCMWIMSDAEASFFLEENLHRKWSQQQMINLSYIGRTSKFVRTSWGSHSKKLSVWLKCSV